MKMNSSNRSTDAERIARVDAATQASIASMLTIREAAARYQTRLNASFSAWINYKPEPRYGVL